MQQILKSTSKQKDQDVPEQSWWKKNKRKKPVKYDIQSLFDKSGLDKDSFKWYYPDVKTREKTKVASSSTEAPSMQRTEKVTETTAKTTISLPGTG